MYDPGRPVWWTYRLLFAHWRRLFEIGAARRRAGGRAMTVGELVQMDEDGLLQLRSFGKTSLDEVKGKLETMGLGLGMKLGEISAAN